MTKQQENRAFVKMLKEFPKAFGRVSFREHLMLRAAFTYVVEEVIADIKANCDLAIEGRDIKIRELELELTVEKDQLQEEINLHLHAEEYIKSLEQQIEKIKTDLGEAIESASKWYVLDPVYSLLVDVYNDNFELELKEIKENE